ncbi:hypothetical protein XELAEV_18018856mg [Xenopus laevis]|uniref:Endonuclease domain-containing 1 protein-like n=1 Tax=Xenopus laevis TaxID=8355 RepID=A0A974HU60_XENLA|nr:hypothetical protein XELAEV_18018856mg [Xenopus laevis]
MKMMLSLGWLFIAIVHMAEPLISDNFTDCRDYFYKGQLPKDKRIPLYSAYILDRRSSCKLLDDREKTFYIEPQELNGKMQHKSALRKRGRSDTQENLERRIASSQAVNANYKYSGYDKGHLNPRCHHETKDGQDATFTLTNVVPMPLGFNRGHWRVYENTTLYKAKECTTMYVVTGIVPGKKTIKNSHVNIPSHIWSAYCCVDNNGNLKSGAGISENKFSKSRVDEMEMNKFVNKLQGILHTRKKFSIFQNNCY